MKLKPLLFLLTIASMFACEPLNIRWQDGYVFDLQTYQSPWPLYNIMVPTESMQVAREITDLFMVEDQTDYAGAGNAAVRTDISLKEYFNNAVSGSPNSRYQIYNNRTPAFNPADPANFRAVAMSDITSTTEVQAWYTMKMTGGLLYKTDQALCNTPYRHPQTIFEQSGGSAFNHSEYIDPSGNLVLTTDETYCYFILMTANSNGLGPYISRVNENDRDSLEYIEKGWSVPYLKLKADLITKLQSGNDDLWWVQGRYVAPGDNGRFLLPQNGLNLLFNRVSVFRPYHHDRQWLATGGFAMTVWRDLNNTIPPGDAGFTIDGWDWFTQRTTTPNRFLKGLVIKASMVDLDITGASGSKQKRGVPIGDQYLGFSPDDASQKEWPFSMHFMTGTAERVFFNKALAGVIAINANRVSESGYGATALPQSALAGVLNPGRLYQFAIKSDYIIIPGGVEGLIPCGSAGLSVGVQALCDNFQNLHDRFVTFIQSKGYGLPLNLDGTAGTWDDIASTLRLVATNGAGCNRQAYTVGTLPVQVCQIGLDIKNFYETNEGAGDNAAPFDIADYQYIQTPSGRNFDVNFFLTRTDVGMRLMLMDSKLQGEMDKDDYLQVSSFTGENGSFSGIINAIPTSSQCSGGTTTDCILFAANQIKTAVEGKYLLLEQDMISSRPFRLYTAVEPEGRKLLTKLGIVEGWIKAVLAYSGGTWPEDVKWSHDSAVAPADPPGEPSLSSSLGACGFTISAVSYPTKEEFIDCLEMLGEASSTPPVLTNPADIKKIYQDRRYDWCSDTWIEADYETPNLRDNELTSKSWTCD